MEEDEGVNCIAGELEGAWVGGFARDTVSGDSGVKVGVLVGS